MGSIDSSYTDKSEHENSERNIRTNNVGDKYYEIKENGMTYYNYTYITNRVELQQQILFSNEYLKANQMYHNMMLKLYYGAFGDLTVEEYRLFCMVHGNSIVSPQLTENQKTQIN